MQCNGSFSETAIEIEMCPVSMMSLSQKCEGAGPTCGGDVVHMELCHAVIHMRSETSIRMTRQCEAAACQGIDIMIYSYAPAPPSASGISVSVCVNVC